MVLSLETDQATSRSNEPISGPRISFSAEFLDENNFISISPHSNKVQESEKEKEKLGKIDFEFLSNDSHVDSIVAADELFFEGKLLPFWQMQNSERLKKISLKPKEEEEENDIGLEQEEIKIIKKDQEESNRNNWFIDEDPSPRPPNCTLLWKELLRLKKHRASTLSPSSSSSSSSSSNSNMDVSSLDDDGKTSKGGIWNREKYVKRIKKGLERTKSASIRIKPVLNMPICSQQGRNSALPPLFPLRKMSVER